MPVGCAPPESDQQLDVERCRHGHDRVLDPGLAGERHADLHQGDGVAIGASPEVEHIRNVERLDVKRQVHHEAVARL